MPGVELVPVDSATKTLLANALACWAKMPNGLTDPDVAFLSCCKQGFFRIEAALCTAYGPFPFTSLGMTIPCDHTATGYQMYTVEAADVPVVDPNDCITTPAAQLAAPTGLAIGTITDTTIDVTWDAVEGANSYTIAWRTTPDGAWTTVTDIGAPTYTVTDLDPLTSYDFRVMAIGDGTVLDSPWSAIITATTETTIPQLATPAPPTITAITDTSITITWTAIPDAEIYVAGVASSLEVEPGSTRTCIVLDWNSMSTAATTMTFTELDPATTYYFDVKATATGWTDSDWSQSVEATTTPPPIPPPPTLAAPTGVTVATTTSTTIELTWDAVADAEVYTVEWRPTGGSDWLAVNNIIGTAFTITDLTPLTGYDLRVMALADGFLSSNWSATATGTTTSLGTLAAPDAPTLVVKTAATVDLSWAPVTNAATYTARRSLAGAGTWTSVPATGNAVQMTGLSASTAYDFQVQAHAPEWGDSAFSASTTVTTSLQTPTLVVGTVTAVSIAVSWAAIPNATWYIVEIARTGTGEWNPAGHAATNHLFAGLLALTTYDLRVMASANGFTDSAWSPVVTRTTNLL
jgi:hypothetical protein